MPIWSIRHKGLRQLFERDDARKLPAASADKLRDMLLAIHTANAVSDIDLVPGWKLHPLKGNLAGLLEPRRDPQLAPDVQIRGR